ncbi:MAG: RnfABCDGE type electron transport complex subunit D [Candidatus Marinimicrobia bacterium]|nr:RnfABCDGE type electron transport complex subunit D [Candidatus Neomarinimicrobiota bacterium]
MSLILLGGFWEVLFAIIRNHEINEGFLVTGILFPLVLPPNTPLWQVALGISFGVVIGKEVFGGAGMAPMRSHIFHLFIQKDQTKGLILVWGALKA